MWKSITNVSGAPLEELHEKHGAGPQLQVFSELELDAFGMTRWWSFWSGAFPNTLLELELVFWSSSNHEMSKQEG